MLVCFELSQKVKGERIRKLDSLDYHGGLNWEEIKIGFLNFGDPLGYRWRVSRVGESEPGCVEKQETWSLERT